MKKIQFLIAFCSILLINCAKEEVETPTNTGVFTLESSGVVNGVLDKKYTCDGQSFAPPLAWKNAPTGTKSFAVIMHHIPPTGDKHVYYVVYKLPSTVTSLPENNTSIGSFGVNTVNGKNSYTPPCSQGPGAKIYIITAYALSAEPVIPATATKVTMDIVLDAIKSTTLAKSELSVSYTRP
ncbi:MAG: YbhB/YbcL family Raf kinase inhibitor-like protein [Emticicia sp.]|uniref:YbhB/YbcL family Raf kinase inhibitor-like protein n=1 Tax=Emticicia sp. TaxID=1930953 RepID=UPI003BA3F7BC